MMILHESLVIFFSPREKPPREPSYTEREEEKKSHGGVNTRVQSVRVTGR